MIGAGAGRRGRCRQPAQTGLWPRRTADRSRPPPGPNTRSTSKRTPPCPPVPGRQDRGATEARRRGRDDVRLGRHSGKAPWRPHSGRRHRGRRAAFHTATFPDANCLTNRSACWIRRCARIAHEPIGHSCRNRGLPTPHRSTGRARSTSSSAKLAPGADHEQAAGGTPREDGPRREGSNDRNNAGRRKRTGDLRSAASAHQLEQARPRPHQRAMPHATRSPPGDTPRA